MSQKICTGLSFSLVWQGTSKRQIGSAKKEKEGSMTETMKAQKMLENKQADEAVVLLEEQVKDHDSEAMWMLGVCNEFGMGTEQDVERAQKLYQASSQQSTTGALLTTKMVNKNGRGNTDMDLSCESNSIYTSHQRARR